MAGRNTHRLQASTLGLFLTLISTVLANDEEKKRRCEDFSFRVHGKPYSPLYWKDGKCHCTYACALNPPHCDKIDCHGAPIKAFDVVYRQPRCERCPVGKKGDCCEVRHCLNGGKLQTDDSCDCTGTDHVGNSCEDRIKHCQNGGEYNKKLNTCKCPKHFTGEECEVCYNGFQSYSGVCQCDDEQYSGKYCEKISCRHGQSVANENQLTSSCQCYPLARGELCESLTDGGIAVIVVVVLIVLACLIVAIFSCRKYRFKQSFYTDQPLYVTGRTEPDISATQPLAVTVTHIHDPQVRSPGESESQDPSALPDYENAIRGERASDF